MLKYTDSEDKAGLPSCIAGLQLLQFEVCCHFKLIQCLCKSFEKRESSPKFGCESGFNAFVVCGLQLDSSVFLYECVKHLSLISPEFSKIKEQPEYSDLEVIRNNIHTFFKKGGFIKKVNSITEEKLNEYKLDIHDYLFPLRNDISLVFQIVDDTRYLIGCDYFIFHCIYESDNKKWCGIDYTNYSAFISSNIKAIALDVEETEFGLSPLQQNFRLPQIELFDYKSANLYAVSNVSTSVTFRLILMLYQISYGILLVKDILDQRVIYQDDLWTCFFTKLLAIKYDESFDNLQSILEFSSLKDNEQLSAELEKNGIIITNLRSRGFARSLRNTIHYQHINIDSNKIFGSLTKDYLIAIYLSNSGAHSMEDFRQKSSEMLQELILLQTTIRQTLSMDKNYIA